MSKQTDSDTEASTRESIANLLDLLDSELSTLSASGVRQVPLSACTNVGQRGRSATADPALAYQLRPGNCGEKLEVRPTTLEHHHRQDHVGNDQAIEAFRDSQKKDFCPLTPTSGGTLSSADEQGDYMLDAQNSSSTEGIALEIPSDRAAAAYKANGITQQSSPSDRFGVHNLSSSLESEESAGHGEAVLNLVPEPWPQPMSVDGDGQASSFTEQHGTSPGRSTPYLDPPTPVRLEAPVDTFIQPTSPPTVATLWGEEAVSSEEGAEAISECGDSIESEPEVVTERDAGFKVNWLALRDAGSGRLLWATKADLASGDPELRVVAKVPKGILHLDAVNRELNFSTAERLDDFRLEQRVLFKGRCLEEWRFQLGAIEAASSQTWTSVFHSTPECQLMPFEALNGHLVLHTCFLDGVDLLAVSTIEIVYV